MIKKVADERKKILASDEGFKRYVIRRAFFVLKRQYRSFNLLNAIANKAIENLKYNYDYHLPFNQEHVDRSIIEVFIKFGAKYWVKRTGWFGKDRIKDQYISRFKGE
ncbi:MAG TPA: hypothetical protein DCS36_08745 [Sphingobacterium sp.]|nr:hypothetical protein [Sphingobacterium sp.]